MIRPAIWLLLGGAAGCSGCEAPGLPAADVVRLPPELREVSAIVVVGADSVACVQDEVGVLFTVGLADGRVRRRQAFGRPGDYEGLCRAGDCWFVLRADGRLLELSADGDRLRVHASWTLPWPHAEWEGVASDPQGSRLVLAPKSVDARGKEGRDRRPLYAFDLATRAPEPAPFLTLSVDRIAAQAEALGVALPTRQTAKGKERLALELAWSEIAVAPGGDFVLLSAADHALLVVDRRGDVRSLQFLDARVLPQPEGLAFLPDGRLLVASEREGGGVVAKVALGSAR